MNILSRWKLNYGKPLALLALLAGAAGWVAFVGRDEPVTDEFAARQAVARAGLTSLERRFEAALEGVGTKVEALRYASVAGAPPERSAPVGISAWAWLARDGSVVASGEFAGPAPRALRDDALANARARARGAAASEKRFLVRARAHSSARGEARYWILGRRSFVRPEEWLVALVDLQELVSIGKAVEPGLRDYLIEEASGVVVAHSQAAYLGSSFAEPQAAQTRAAGAKPYLAIDRLRVASAYAVNSEYGLRLVTEKVLPPTSAEFSGWRRLLDPQAWIAFATLALFGFALAAWRRMNADASARSEPELPSLSEAFARASPVIVPSARALNTPESRIEVVPVPLDAAATLQRALESVNERQARSEVAERDRAGTRQKLEALQQFERECVESFSSDIQRLREPRQIAQRLADSASQLCASETLFFAYHEGASSALLVAHAGFAPGKAPLGLSFPLPTAAVRRIIEAAGDGKLVSLSQFEPLARLLLGRIDVAHFDAWSVTGYRSELARSLRQARLLGILVVLQSGVDSVMRKDSLKQMIQATGARYESTIPLR